MTPPLQVGVAALSWSGLEESWSPAHSFLLLLVLANVLPVLLGKSGAGSRQQTFSQLTQMAVGVTWLATFLSYQGFDTAAHNQVGGGEIGLPSQMSKTQKSQVCRQPTL